MEFGIIAEGKGDCAVLKNIIVGVLGLEEEDIRFLRPEFGMDNTEKATYTNMNADEFGSWTLIKKDCEAQTKLKNFLESPIAGERYIVIQIDTAECEQKGYGVIRPDKNLESYSDTLRNLVVQKINEWLEGKWSAQIRYAICIEEMEAWIHTLYEEKDSTIPLQAKEAFQKQRSRNKKFDKQLKKLQQKTEFEKSDFYSKDFRKNKLLQKSLANNQSLQAFVVSLEELSK